LTPLLTILGFEFDLRKTLSVENVLQELDDDEEEEGQEREIEREKEKEKEAKKDKEDEKEREKEREREKENGEEKGEEKSGKEKVLRVIKALPLQVIEVLKNQNESESGTVTKEDSRKECEEKKIVNEDDYSVSVKARVRVRIRAGDSV
jgi:hypothetical protein